jgi:hypothetical protein
MLNWNMNFVMLQQCKKHDLKCPWNKSPACLSLHETCLFLRIHDASGCVKRFTFKNSCLGLNAGIWSAVSSTQHQKQSVVRYPPHSCSQSLTSNHDTDSLDITHTISNMQTLSLWIQMFSKRSMHCVSKSMEHVSIPNIIDLNACPHADHSSMKIMMTLAYEWACEGVTWSYLSANTAVWTYCLRSAPIPSMLPY